MHYRGTLDGDDDAEYLRRLQGAAEDCERGTAEPERYARIWRVNFDDLEEHREAVDAADGDDKWMIGT